MGITARRIGAGFLAGVSSIIGMLVLLLLVLFSAGIWDALRTASSDRGSFGQIVGRALGQSLLTLPSYFWSARWGMLALGLLGMVLALVDGFRVRVVRPWREWSGFVLTFGLVTAILIGLIYTSREALTTFVVEQPYLFTQRDLVLASDSSLLFVGLIVALGVAYVIWATWQSWYLRWVGWLRVPRTQWISPTQTSAPATDDWRAYQERLARLKRPTVDDEPPPVPATAPMERSWLRFLIPAAVLTLLLAFAAIRAYNAVGPSIASGELFVSPEQQSAQAALPLSRAPQRVVLSNTAGNGSINIRLVADGDPDPVREVQSMRLSDDASQFATSNLDLHGLQPATYRLDLQLNEGRGGVIRYIALHGGGTAAQLVGLLVGLTVGLCVAIVCLMLLDLLANAGMISSP